MRDRVPGEGRRGRRGFLLRPALPITLVLTILIVLMLWSSFFRGFERHTGLIIAASDGGKIISHPLNRNDRFTIRYTHSVDRVPVIEYYRIDEDGCLVLEMFENQTFGAGLGDQMGELALIDGRQVVKNINLVLDRLPLRVGSIADQVIIVGGNHHSDGNTVKALRLLDDFETGELVYIYYD